MSLLTQFNVISSQQEVQWFPIGFMMSFHIINHLLSISSHIYSQLQWQQLKQVCVSPWLIAIVLNRWKHISLIFCIDFPIHKHQMAGHFVMWSPCSLGSLCWVVCHVEQGIENCYILIIICWKLANWDKWILALHFLLWKSAVGFRRVGCYAVLCNHFINNSLALIEGLLCRIEQDLLVH